MYSFLNIIIIIIIIIIAQFSIERKNCLPARYATYTNLLRSNIDIQLLFQLNAHVFYY
jgi:hypothetical protein